MSRDYQGSLEWLEERRTGIGSSDAPKLVGVSKWGGALDVYNDKVGPIRPPDPDPKKRAQQQLGLDLEEAIAKVWAKSVGCSIRRKHKIARHPSMPFIMASLDFEIVGARTVVEVKTRRNGRGFGEPGTATVPDDIWVQVQHQMLATGYGAAYVIAMIAGAPPVDYYVTRDNEFLEDYTRLAEDFWTNNVLAANPPQFDGSESGDRILRERYPDSAGEVIATPEAEILAGQLQDVRRRLAEVKTEEATIVQRLKDFIGPKERLIGPGFRINYKYSKPAKTVKWAAVAEDYAEALAGFGVEEDALDAVVAQHTSENQPARPFLVEFEEEMD